MSFTTTTSSVDQLVAFTIANAAFAPLNNQIPNLVVISRTGLTTTAALTFGAGGTQYTVTLPTPATWTVTFKVV